MGSSRKPGCFPRPELLSKPGAPISVSSVLWTTESSALIFSPFPSSASEQQILRKQTNDNTMLVSMFPSGVLAPPVLVAWDALQGLQTNFFSFLLSLLYFLEVSGFHI